MAIPKAMAGQQIDRICDAFETAWLNDQTPHIEDYLDDSLGEFRQELIAELVALDVSYRRNRGEMIPVDQYLVRFPEAKSELRPFLISLMDNTVKTVHSPNDTHPDPSKTDRRLELIGKDFGNYELIEEIARGGMGVVFRARQKSTNRPVALKMILAGQFANEDEIRRFHAEAEAVAKLDHPNIVPIYDAGEHKGYHYLAMAFVEGGDLNQYCGEQTLNHDTICSILLALAEAIEYAHQNQIVHRDLKPANILLTRRMRPRITDFGLARQVENDSQLTATGQVVGTPSFMAPEQARGNSATIGPRSDVYSLGAILYALLVGRPPFREDTVVDTITAVLAEEPVAPRSISPSIPKDLETICLKCLEKDPDRRYQSGSELADELKRFANREPILARPISTTARGWRWCKRNARVASLLAAFVLSLIVGAGTAAYYAVLADSRANNLQVSNQMLKAANQREVSLAQRASASAEFANRQSEKIMQILENVMLDVADRLEKVPGAQEARREILKQGMSGLELLSTEIRDNSRAQFNSISALVQMADIYQRMGDEQGMSGTENALASLDLAASIGEPLLEESPDDLDVQRAMIAAYHEQGNLLIDTGRFDLAVAPIEKMVRLARQMVDKNLDPSQLESAMTNLVAAENIFGKVALKQREFDVSATRFKAAVETAKKLVEEYPNLATMKLLTKAYEGVGDSYLDGGQPKLAEPYYEQSMDVSQQMVDQEPSPENRWLLAIAYERVGELNRALDQNEKALIAYQKSYDESVPLYEKNQDDIRYQLGFAITYCKLAQTYMRLNRPDKVIDAYTKALEIRLPIAKADPDDLETQRVIINSYQGIGVAYESKGEWEQAIRNYQIALDYYQSCEPEAKDYLKYLEDWLNNRIESAQKSQQDSGRK